ERDQLLQAVKAELNNSGTSPPPPSSPGDTIQPSVTITSPPDNATVSNIISLVAEASDNAGIARVEFYCDGNALGNQITKDPYAMEYNSHQLSDGSHVIIATATDVNGNQGSSSISLTVDNSPKESPLFPDNLLIYKDNLASNWINSSWNSTVDFSNSELVHLGNRSIKVQQQPWGALSLHSGTWDQPEKIDPEQYDSLQFAIYVAGSNGDLTVLAEDTETSFPDVPYGMIPANTWTWISIPLDKISPQAIPFDRIDITETSGSSITYYIDHIRFTVAGSSGEKPQPPSRPNLLAPSNSAENVSLAPSFDWQNCPNAKRYEIQIAADGSFNNLVVSRDVTDDDIKLTTSLMPDVEYYWRVRSVNEVHTSKWSDIWSFATLARRSPVFDEELHDPWINASWNAMVDFSSSEHSYGGSKSIEVVQNSWGALSLHYGNWGRAKDLSEFSTVEFKVYTENPEISLRIMLENDSGDSFAVVNRAGIPGEQWIDVSVDLNEMNPEGYVANRIDISESSGSSTTYYIDDLYMR
ncbi:MAG TPA: Ig-like domain-containing protein, partial [bacterium]|nr:Ig-like domain-containing protein [bacterium]